MYHCRRGGPPSGNSASQQGMVRLAVNYSPHACHESCCKVHMQSGNVHQHLQHVQCCSWSVHTQSWHMPYMRWQLHWMRLSSCASHGPLHGWSLPALGGSCSAAPWCPAGRSLLCPFQHLALACSSTALPLISRITETGGRLSVPTGSGSTLGVTFQKCGQAKESSGPKQWWPAPVCLQLPLQLMLAALGVLCGRQWCSVDQAAA